MPYKIVQTIEGGKICLSVVPSKWEKGGTLSWPPRSEASSMLDENSVPSNSWATYPCLVKRSFDTYKAAQREMTRMQNETDTEEEPTGTLQKESDCIFDLNNLMQDCGYSTATVAPITVTQSSDTASAEHNIISLNDVNTSFLLKNDNDEVIKNQMKILEILQDVQNTQKKILQQVAKHEVQYTDLLNKMADFGVATGNNNPEGSVQERFPPIKTVEELLLLEDNLKNPEFRTQYFKVMSTLCSPGLGTKGSNICYRIVDYFFSRELLTLVSWSGNSRDQNEKVAFKFFTQIRNIFFSIIHNADPSISQIETDNFIKAVIKNSKQRFQATNKPSSVSTKKNRKKCSNNAKSSNGAAESISGSNTGPTVDADEVPHPTINVDEQNNDLL